MKNNIKIDFDDENNKNMNIDNNSVLSKVFGYFFDS